MQQAIDEDGYIWNVDAQGNPVGDQPVGRANPQQPAPNQVGPRPFTVGTPRSPEAPKPPSGYRWTGDGNLQPIPGGPEDPTVISGKQGGKSLLTAKERADAIAGYQSASRLEDIANDIEAQYRGGVGSTSGLASILDYFPTGANRRFDSTGNQSRGIIKQALGFTGGEGNTATESQTNYGPYIPQASDFDTDIEGKIQALRDLAQQARSRSIAILGGIPDANGNITPIQQGGPTVLPQAAGAQADPEGVGREGISAASAPQNGQGGGNQNATVESGPPGSQGGGTVTPLWSADQDARERNTIIGAIDAYGRNAANAATLGVADKIAAAGNAILPIDNLFGADNRSVWDGSSFGQAYDANMLLQNRTNAADRKANPWASTAGDVSGTVAGALLANQALAKAGAGALVARTGGVAGDVSYGAARGAVDDGARGAATGAALALGGGVLGRYVLGPTIGAAAATKPGQAVVNTIGRGANALGNAGRGLLGRRPVPYRPVSLPAPVSGGERAALARVPDDLTQQLAGAERMGLPLALADTSPQLQSLSGSVVRKSPDAYALARETLGARALGQADRAQEQIVRNFGPVANPNEISDQLLQQARTNSAPLYDAFRSQPARTSDELQAILQTPAGQTALQNARSIAANEGRDPNALGFDLDQQGNVFLRSDPSPETLDLVKRGLDDVVGGYRNPITGQLDLNDQGRAVEGLRQRFVGEVDRLYPNYADARRAYAGPAGEREALSQGRAMVNANPRDIQVTMGRMAPSQVEQFRLGQRVGMSDAVDRVRFSSNPYQNIYGSPVAQQRAATVFGEGPAANMRAAYDVEQRMAQTAYDTLGGSPTAMRSAADEAFDSPMATALDAGFSAATGGGGVPELGRKAANYLKDTYRLGASKKKADQLAPILFNTDPAAIRAAIEALGKKSAARDVYIKRARKVGGLFGAGLGISAASSGN